MLQFLSQSFSSGRRPVKIIKDPNQLPTLEVWYNADIANATNFGNNIPVNGGDVSPWTDRAGGSKDLNKAGGASVKPNWYANQLGVGNTYGVIRFNGTSESLDINPVSWMQSLSGFSLFVVAKASAVGVTARTICSTNTGGFQITHNGSYWRVEAGGCSGVSAVTGTGDTSKYNIYALIFDGAGIGNTSRLKFRYNKVPQTLTYTGTAATITSASAATFYVGVGSAGNSQYLNGDIAEIFMFKRALNSSEIGGLESYLTAHWNL